MVPIYIKLGTANKFYDERSKITLEEGIRNVMVLDYQNMNENLIDGLNAGYIVQIDQTEYHQYVPPPIEHDYINPDSLTDITRTWEEPVPDEAIFFMKYENSWYRVPYLWMKSGEAVERYNRVFRVGDPGQVAVDTNTFVDENLIGIPISMKVNGITIYKYSDDPNIDYYNYDVTTGTITRPALFKAGEVIEINQVS